MHDAASVVGPAGGAPQDAFRLGARRSGLVARLRHGIALALVGAGLSGCGAAATVGGSPGSGALQVPQTPPLATAPVRQGTVTYTARVTGRIVSTRTADLYFHNGGTVSAVDVADGAAVRGNALLAALDSGSLRDRIAAAVLSVARDRLGLASLRASQSVPTSAVEAETALVALRQSELALQRDKLSLADQRLTLQEDEVHAPFAGIVNDVSIASGDQVGGFQTVMVLSDPSALEYQASVSQPTAAVLRSGQSAQVLLGTSASRAWPAAVTTVHIPSLQAIAQAAANSNGTVVLLPTVTFAVQRPPTGLSIGQRFTAVVTLAQARRALYVPSDAIRRFGGSTYVDILSRGVVAEVPVTTGIHSGTVTAVTRGLRRGEQVVEP